jgi:hypothetical protein
VDRISDILTQMTNGTIIAFWPTFFHCPFRNWPTSRMFNPHSTRKEQKIEIPNLIFKLKSNKLEFLRFIVAMSTIAELRILLQILVPSC